MRSVFEKTTSLERWRKSNEGTATIRDGKKSESLQKTLVLDFGPVYRVGLRDNITISYNSGQL